MAPDERNIGIKKLYYCKNLKWYQKILQKLHIKNYWKELNAINKQVEKLGWKYKGLILCLK